MLDFIDHPANAFIVGEGTDLVQFGESESLDRSPLRWVLRDQALRQFDFDHNLTLFSLDGERLASHPPDEFGATKGAQTGKSGTQNIVRVVRANGLGQNVMDAGGFHDGTHGAASDDAGTGGSGLQQNLSCPEIADDLIRDGAVKKFDLLHALAGSVGGLLDRIGYLVGFAEAEANRPLAVTHDDQGAETESTATLHNFGDAIEIDYFLNEFKFVLLHGCPRLKI
jgi:hypothetical protein